MDIHSYTGTEQIESIRPGSHRSDASDAYPAFFTQIFSKEITS